MKKITMTVEEAYMAMFYFLGIDYQRGPSDEIGGMLSSLSWNVIADRRPADSGAWEDWLVAVGMSLERREGGLKDMSETYQHMFNFERE